MPGTIVMSEFNLSEAAEVLHNTPAVLRAILGGISETWTASKGDQSAWMPFDIVGHLIHGEKTDWIPRAQIIRRQGSVRTFVAFDRTAQFEDAKGKSIEHLLDEFSSLRMENLELLHSWNLTEDELELEGNHPELGTVTLRQLLSTWVVHDLGHVRQIVTVMANRYREDVGPWRQYLSIIG